MSYLRIVALGQIKMTGVRLRAIYCNKLKCSTVLLLSSSRTKTI